LPYYEHILNLQPFIDADPDFNINDFYPQFLEAFRREGDLWGLPLEGDLQLLLYNKDLFDEAGVEYPQAGWTLEDFLEKAIALTNGQGENKVYGYVPFGDPGVDLLLIFGELEVVLVDAEAQPPRPQLDNPAVVSALRWYTDLALKYGVMPIFKSGEFREDTKQILFEQFGLISAGRAAMWIGHPKTYFERLLPPRIGAAPLPLGQRKIGMREIGVLGFVISTKAAHPQACWEWIKFASERSTALVSGWPARRSIAESEEYRSWVGEEVAEALLYTMEHIDPSLDAVEKENPWLIVLYYWLSEAYDRVLEGVDVEEALIDAQAKAEAFVDCLGEEISSADRAQYWACAKEVDPEVEPPPDLR
jgi:multiple sugar transport system substrate-binding protein